MRAAPLYTASMARESPARQAAKSVTAQAARITAVQAGSIASKISAGIPLLNHQ
jgi:hypothetical protein